MANRNTSFRVRFATAGAIFLLTLLVLICKITSSRTLQIFSSRLAGPSTDYLLEHASNKTLGFEKIFVINVPSRYDRRDSMSLAAALTELQIEFVDGVVDVPRKDILPGGVGNLLSDTDVMAARAHINVLRRIVEQNVTTALILEDDVDWDIRIKSQMRDFAKASRLLVQPVLGSTNRFLDPTYPRPSADQDSQDFDVDVETTSVPAVSPYGDIYRWDLLWLGHCGGRFPRVQDKSTALGRAIIYNDVTVPEPQHIDIQFGNRELMERYPAHTRVVSRAHGTVCTLAYAVTQAGAQRFLHEFGVHKTNAAMDIMFRNMCDGLSVHQNRTCLTVQPQLFQHHRPVATKSTFSDLQDHGNETNGIAYTRNIRWSTHLNFKKLLDGETDYVDSYKDGEKARNGLSFG